MKIKVSNVNTPNWKDVNVKSHIPVELEKLSELARNIWWSWNYEATELFRDLDPALWTCAVWMLSTPSSATIWTWSPTRSVLL